ncbi:hypothetical protein M9458_050816, partial [Cirrhinus mrigala]
MEEADVKLDEIIEKLTQHLKEHFKIKEAEQEIVAKYKIRVQKDGLWEPDDIKKAWGKIQRMKTRESRRIPWIFATLSKCRKWEIKLQTDNHNRDKEVMERKLKGLQDRCQEFKAQLENEQKPKPANANLQNVQKTDQNQFPVLPHSNASGAGSDTDMTTDSDSDTDTDDCEGATAKLRPLRVNIKKGKKRTEVYLQKTKEGNVLMDREVRDSDVMQYKYTPPTSKEVKCQKRPEISFSSIGSSERDFSLIVSINLSLADRKSLKGALGESLSGEHLIDDRAEREG